MVSIVASELDACGRRLVPKTHKTAPTTNSPREVGALETRLGRRMRLELVGLSFG